MSGIGSISSSTAIRVVRPVHNAGDSGSFHRDETSGARRAYATAGASSSGSRSSQSGAHAPFFTQMIANDDDASATPAQGAIAYLVARDRITDLPVGFLIARAV